MRTYFLAERPCALLVNGLYLGSVDGFERTAEIDPADGVFCELLSPGYEAVRFRFDEAFLLSPPPQIGLYFCKKEVAVYANGFLRSDPSLRLIWQERCGNTLLTLYMQGRLQLNIENETGFHLIDLPERLSDSHVRACGSCFLLEGNTAFAILGRDGTMIANCEGKVLEWGETITADVSFRDSVGHTARMTWQDGKTVSCTIRTAREPTPATYALALFESVLLGADPTPYLAPALLPKADLLKEFLGEYISVSLLGNGETGLVYERKKGVYDVRCFAVETQDGKISNLTEI